MNGLSLSAAEDDQGTITADDDQKTVRMVVGVPTSNPTLQSSFGRDHPRIEKDDPVIEQTNALLLPFFLLVLDASQGRDASSQALQMFSAEIASHAWIHTAIACL
jgi:hypothetical protein